MGLDKQRLITVISMLCRALEIILKNNGTECNAAVAWRDGAEPT